MDDGRDVDGILRHKRKERGLLWEENKVEIVSVSLNGKAQLLQVKDLQ